MKIVRHSKVGSITLSAVVANFGFPTFKLLLYQEYLFAGFRFSPGFRLWSVSYCCGVSMTFQMLKTLDVWRRFLTLFI